jgi:hypothetical protein
LQTYDVDMERKHLAKIFLYCYPYRKYCLVFAVLCLISLIYTFIAFSSEQQDVFLIPAVLGLLWSLILYLSICIFQPMTLLVNNSSLLQRIKRKLSGFLKILLVLIFTVLTLAVIIFSFRLYNALS